VLVGGTVTRQRRSSPSNRDASTYAHKRLRKQWLARLAAAGQLGCVRCGGVILPGMLVDLDHTDDRTGYLGLAHRSCNRRDGQRKTVSILKARGWTPSPRQLRAAAARRQQREVPPQSSRRW
jgi:hypothetical protein